MTTSTLNIPQRGWFDVLDDIRHKYKRDRFVFVGWSGLLFPTAYMAIGSRVMLLALRLSRVGTPTDSQVVILRVLIFSQCNMSQRLLTLWVILFFYFGVLSLREISNAGSNLGDSGILWRSTVPSP